MTEDEAKAKWCPFARVVLNTGKVGNRRDDAEKIVPIGRCIGSACMAWKQDMMLKYDQPDSPIHRYVIDPDSGRCGLTK